MHIISIISIISIIIYEEASKRQGNSEFASLKDSL